MAYIPVRGKESRIEQLRRVAANYEQGRLTSPNGRVMADNLRDVAQRLANRMAVK